MKLLELRVKNFATYPDQVINFEKLEYPVFIEGRTGAGKTTLFVDAITAALYGRAYGDNKASIAKETIMQGKECAIVEFAFEAFGKRYKIVREFRKNSTGEAKLYILDEETGEYKLLLTGVSRVDNEIMKIIGFKYQTLISSTIVRQGEVLKFLNSPPRNRREFLLELLNLKVFEKYRELAKERYDEKVTERKVLEAEISRIKGFVEKLPTKKTELQREKEKLPEKQKEYELIFRDIENWKGKLEELEEKLRSLSSELGRYNQLEKTLEELKREEMKLAREIKQIENMLSRYPKEALEKADEGITMINEAKAIGERLQRLDQELKIIRDAERDLTQLNNLSKEVEKLKKHVTELEESKRNYNEAVARQKVIISKMKEIKEHLEALKQGVGRCPVCGAPLTEERKREREKELNREYNELAEEYEQLKVRTKELEALIERLEEKSNLYNNLKGRISTLEKNVNRYKGKLEKKDEIHREINELLSRKREIESFIESIVKTRDLEKAEKILREVKEASRKIQVKRDRETELNRVRLEIVKINEELLGKEKIEEEYQRVKNEIMEIKRKVETLEKAKERALQEISEIKTRISQLEEEIAELEKMEEEIRTKQEELIELEKDIKALHLLINNVFKQSTLPTKLLETYIKAIEEYANDYLRWFGQDIKMKMKLEGRGDDQRIDIHLYSNNYKRNIKTFSGGESALIGFAIRLAIGRLISEIGSKGSRPRFLIIDEGFGALDEELRVKVAEALASLMENKEYEQVIMISHQRELKDSEIFRDVLRIVKERGASKIVAERDLK
ncbi:MAG: SbcC/MukB-like Walker B domain-containing protein [Candidatus Njordarchaeia archaeon]